MTRRHLGIDATRAKEVALEIVATVEVDERRGGERVPGARADATSDHRVAKPGVATAR